MLRYSLPYFNNPIGVAEWAQPNYNARIARISRTEYSLKASITYLARPGMTLVVPIPICFGISQGRSPFKGGDPATPSGTATLLRLHPSHQPHLRRPPPQGLG